MNKNLKRKCIIYIKELMELPDLSTNEKQNLQFLRILFSNKSCNNKYISINDNVYFFENENFTLEEISELILYLVDNNIKFYEKANIEELKSILNRVSDTVLFSEKESEFFLVAALGEFKKYQEIYTEFKEKLDNKSSLSDYESMLNKLNLDIKYASYIFNILNKEEVKKEITFKKENKVLLTDKKREKEKLKQILTLKKYLNDDLELLNILSEDDLKLVVSLMKQLGYHNDIINKIIRNNNLLIKKEEDIKLKLKIDNIMSEFLSYEEIQLINNAKDIKNTNLGKEYNIDKLLEDINECILLIIDNADIDYVDMLKEIVSELNEKLNNIILINKGLKYSISN